MTSIRNRNEWIEWASYLRDTERIWFDWRMLCRMTPLFAAGSICLSIGHPQSSIHPSIRFPSGAGLSIHRRQEQSANNRFFSFLLDHLHHHRLRLLLSVTISTRWLHWNFRAVPQHFPSTFRTIPHQVSPSFPLLSPSSFHLPSSPLTFGFRSHPEQL